jgi:hypothetical protein
VRRHEAAFEHGEHRVLDHVHVGIARVHAEKAVIEGFARRARKRAAARGGSRGGRAGG